MAIGHAFRTASGPPRGRGPILLPFEIQKAHASTWPRFPSVPRPPHPHRLIFGIERHDRVPRLPTLPRSKYNRPNPTRCPSVQTRIIFSSLSRVGGNSPAAMASASLKTAHLADKPRAESAACKLKPFTVMPLGEIRNDRRESLLTSEPRGMIFCPLATASLAAGCSRRYFPPAWMAARSPRFPSG